MEDVFIWLLVPLKVIFLTNINYVSITGLASKKTETALSEMLIFMSKQWEK